MKFILPVIGTVAAVGLFAATNYQQTAIAVERPSNTETFQQLELFADVLARVRNDYVINVNDADLIEDAINGMLQALDPHSSYVNPDGFRELQTTTTGEYGGLGMEVLGQDGIVRVVSPIDDTPADRAGIKAGDLITEIEGESIIGLTTDEAVDQMRGRPGEPITITIVREGEEKPLEFTMTREVIKRKVVTHDVKDGIGYLRISQFNETTDKTLNEAVDALRKEFSGRIPGIVLDLRSNPGGLLDQSVKVSSAFLDGGEVVSTRGRAANDTQRYNAQNGELLPNIPLVVLIDNASASASEIVAGAIQDRSRGIVVGLTSFGKGSVQSIIPLRGGRDGALRLTTQRYYTPSGRSIQGTGITPDIAVAALPDDGEGNERRSESDLRNSIENENSESGENEDKPLVVDYPPEDFNVEDDYQLMKAIKILKDGSYNQRLAELK